MWIFFFFKALKWAHQNGPWNLSLFIECAGFSQRGAGQLSAELQPAGRSAGWGPGKLAGPSLVSGETVCWAPAWGWDSESAPSYCGSRPYGQAARGTPLWGSFEMTAVPWGSESALPRLSPVLNDVTKASCLLFTVPG